MSMRFKVGDKVKVRKDLEIGILYGNYYFSTSMAKFKGKQFTIIEVNEEYTYYRTVEDNGSWKWTDEMLEPIEEKQDLRELLVDGVIVKTRERGNMIYLGGVFNSTNTLSKNEECASICYEFNKNLEGGIAEWTIDSIYKITNMDFYSLNVIIDELPEENVKLIWKRPKEREWFDINTAIEKMREGKSVRNTYMDDNNIDGSYYFYEDEAGFPHYNRTFKMNDKIISEPIKAVEFEKYAQWYEVEE